LLDEVIRLTYFSQEDSAMLALHDPYDITHHPSEVIFWLPYAYTNICIRYILIWLIEPLFTSQVPSTIEYFSTVSEVEEHPEDGDSTANVESHAE
jgi:hypothetical protein